jgi:competence protein ComEA
VKLRLALLLVFLSLGLSLSACEPTQPREITISTTAPHYIGTIYISGAVNSPGIYPLKAEDTLGDLIQAAGGLQMGADQSQVRLSIPEAGESALPQRIDINRAEAWLIQALPDIGPTTAQNIIDHRRQNGPFRSIDDLLKVKGIGLVTLGKIKDLITVSD